MKFDGVSAHVEVPDSNSLDVTGKITIMAWCYWDVDEISKEMAIVAKWHDPEGKPDERAYIISSGPPGGINLLHSTISHDGTHSEGITAKLLASNSELPRKKWVHVAMTFDGKVFKLYINGKEDNSADFPGPIFASDNPLWIGGLVLAPIYFKGMIDEAAVFDTALTEKEIQELMAKSLRTLEPAGKLTTTWGDIKADVF